MRDSLACNTVVSVRGSHSTVSTYVQVLKATIRDKFEKLKFHLTIMFCIP